MRLTTILLLSLSIAFSNATIQKLGDVFHVDTRDPEQYPSSCLSKLDDEDDTTVIFDPHAQSTDKTRILNRIWYWINFMTVVADQGIQAAHYNDNYDTRKLMWSFFGIFQATQTSPEDSFEPAADSLHGQKLQTVRDWYRNVANIITHTQPNGPGKPKLFCDSTFAIWQTGDEHYLDKDGKSVKRRNSDEPYTLKQWERRHGREFRDNWYFWVDFEGTRGYLVHPKEEPTAQYPYPRHEKTGRHSYCADEENAGWTWNYANLPDQSGGGTSNWIRQNIITLCPSTFEAEEDQTDDPDFRPMEAGTHLDEMGIPALTFMHELFHAAFPIQADDHQPRFAKYTNVDKEEIDPSWPLEKSSFDTARYAKHADAPVLGALQSMLLARWELARPESPRLRDLESIHSPESYAWFALTMLMEFRTGQDWSTGAARPGKSPAEAVTASIPYMFPPAAKVGPVTKDGTHGGQHGEDDMTRMWSMNTTSEMGPITAFPHDLTTLMASIKARL